MIQVLQQLFNQAGVPDTKREFLEGLEEWCRHEDTMIHYFPMAGGEISNFKKYITMIQKY